MNCVKGSWDIFTPNWSQKISVMCHYPPWGELKGDVKQQTVLPLEKSVCLGIAQNPQHPPGAALPPHLSVSQVLCKRRQEEEHSISNVAELFRLSSYITTLEDFHQILPGCYRAAALISACSHLLSIPLSLSESWAFLEKYRDTAFINSPCEFLCARPVSFFILNF